MTVLAGERCFNHGRREAVAKCPGCGRSFCRECVTEHQGLMLCAGCLEAALGDRSDAGSRFGFLVRPFLVACGLLAVWLLFYLLGHGVASMPAPFHEGTFWQEP